MKNNTFTLIGLGFVALLGGGYFLFNKQKNSAQQALAAAELKFNQSLSKTQEEQQAAYQELLAAQKEAQQIAANNSILNDITELVDITDFVNNSTGISYKIRGDAYQFPNTLLRTLPPSNSVRPPGRYAHTITRVDGSLFRINYRDEELRFEALLSNPLTN